MFDIFNRRTLQHQAEIIDSLMNTIDTQSVTLLDQAALIKGLKEANEAHRLENVRPNQRVDGLRDIVCFYCRAGAIKRQTLADIERELAEEWRREIIKPWRPPNWGNDYYDGAAKYAINTGGIFSPTYDHREFNRLKREGTAYEAGADAILEALR